MTNMELIKYLAVLADLKRAGLQNQQEVDRAIAAIEKRLGIER
ncbi:hypothetical protein [Domibacillus antri]|nr:hypothetical protein [Domibacillus antri]